MGSEKLHKLTHTHLDPELLSDLPGPLGRNAGDLRQPFRLPLHDLQGFFSEMCHDPCGGFGADPLDDPAGEICLDLAGGLGHEPLQKFRLKLLAVAGMGAPLPRYHKPLPHHRQGNGPNHRHRLALSDVQPQNGVAVVVILVYHRLDGALQNL